MSTLSRHPSRNKLPDYKDYMNFVSGYRNGKNEANHQTDDDGHSTIVVSLKPIQTKSFGPPKVCESYTHFLENTKDKKFGSVKLDIPNKIDSSKKMVKTEIFIEINQDPIWRENGRRCEGNDYVDDATVFSTNNGVEAKKKMFENKTTPVGQDPIELNNVSNFTSKPIKRFTSIQHHNQNFSRKNGICSAISANLDTSKKGAIIRSFENLSDKRLIKASDETKEQINNEGNNLHDIRIEMIRKLGGAVSNEDKLKTVASISIPNENNSWTTGEPPIPPPMPNFNEIPRKTPTTIIINATAVSNSAPTAAGANFPIGNGIRKSDLNTDRLSTKSSHGSSLDRRDPLVRKLAYGAMLDMYGAYHDKANSYVATLPKNMVRKENGLRKIIDNIAAQGGLEKLSGRSNPKAENE